MRIKEAARRFIRALLKTGGNFYGRRQCEERAGPWGLDQEK